MALEGVHLAAQNPLIPSSGWVAVSEGLRKGDAPERRAELNMPYSPLGHRQLLPPLSQFYLALLTSSMMS